MALGSAMAMFMYPHSITATLSSRSRNVIRKSTTVMPLYTLMLGLLALLGFMAIAAGVKVTNGQLAIPQLFEDMFPDWFAGVAFAAIGIGALVPAAIMSIAAANLFTRNIYKDFLKPNATPAQGARVSKLVSLLVKVGALVFVLKMDKTVAINFQLLGGIWILQTFPSLVGGLFTRWFHRWALLAGWAVGMVYGTLAAYGVASPTQQHFGGSAKEIPGIGEIGYIGLTAFVLNVLVTVVLTFALKAVKAPGGVDETSPDDYTADTGDTGDKGVQAARPQSSGGNRALKDGKREPGRQHSRHPALARSLQCGCGLPPPGSDGGKCRRDAVLQRAGACPGPGAQVHPVGDQCQHIGRGSRVGILLSAARVPAPSPKRRGGRPAGLGGAGPAPGRTASSAFSETSVCVGAHAAPSRVLP